MDPAEIRAARALVPPSWTLIEKGWDGGAFRRGSIQVIMSVARYDDGNLSLHVSAGAVRGRYYLLSWEELKRVKHDFIGEDRRACQVFPPPSQYVRQNPCVPHLFAI